jgi:hypothetical protein
VFALLHGDHDGTVSNGVRKSAKAGECDRAVRRVFLACEAVGTPKAATGCRVATVARVQYRPEILVAPGILAIDSVDLVIE